jgi:hypothetical protein
MLAVAATVFFCIGNAEEHAEGSTRPAHDLDDIKGGDFINAAFVSLDKDGDSKLSKDELIEFEFLNDKANSDDALKLHKAEGVKLGGILIEERDSNSDKVVSLAEFLENDRKANFQMIISVEGAWEKEQEARRMLFQFADADKSGRYKC